MATFTTSALVITSVLTGLGAGFFYAWSCSVMPGLAKADDRTFVEAMQSVNRAVLNPMFAAGFFGPMIGTPICGVLLFLSGETAALTATIVALVAFGAAFLITMARNQPMNLALDTAGPADDIPDLHTVRQSFEGPWVRWNHLRTATSVVSLCALLLALVAHISG